MYIKQIRYIHSCSSLLRTHLPHVEDTLPKFVMIRTSSTILKETNTSQHQHMDTDTVKATIVLALQRPLQSSLLMFTR